MSNEVEVLEQLIAGQAAQIERANGNITLLAAEVKRLRAVVAAVEKVIESYERSGYPDALIPKGTTMDEFRAALSIGIGG